MSMQKYKVPSNSIKSYSEIVLENRKKRFENLLEKELKSERDVYDNIFKLQDILSYAHDDIPNARNRVNEKLYYIQKELGKEVLNKGLDIYKQHKGLTSLCPTMSFEDRTKIEQEIMHNASLAEQLDDMRYNPEKYRGLTGKKAIYLAVFCNMIEKEFTEREKEKEENTI